MRRATVRWSRRAATSRTAFDLRAASSRRRQSTAVRQTQALQELLELSEPTRSGVTQLNRVFPPTQVRIGMLVQAAELAQHREEQALMNAEFIRQELLARRVFGLSMLMRAEEDGGVALRALMRQPQLQELKMAYWQRLRMLAEYPRIKDPSFVHDFNARMRTDFFAQDGETRLAVGQALAGLRDEEGGAPSDPEDLEISAFLDAFFSQRVGLRFLVEHYLASAEPRKGYAGIIEMECAPVQLMEKLGRETRKQMREIYGAAPPIEVHGDPTQTFCYVRAHVEFVLGELLRNATKATIKRHLPREGRTETELPPVKVILAASPEHVTFKVADTAGGIARSQLRNFWSYRGKTAKRWGQGVGLGLPLARLYASYFGGSMYTVPMEGHGTDCYVVFNRLASANSENILKVPHFGMLAQEEEARAAKETMERPRQGRSRHAIRLFDAQTRRDAISRGE